MFKDFLIVGAGSFFGGGARYLVSRLMQTVAAGLFPWGTFAVNILGCLLIGLFYGLDAGGQWISPRVRLALTTGFCGGFTTFSTFINEGSLMLKDGNYGLLALYFAGSLLLGFIALAAGYQIAKAL